MGFRKRHLKVTGGLLLIAGGLVLNAQSQKLETVEVSPRNTPRGTHTGLQNALTYINVAPYTVTLGPAQSQQLTAWRSDGLAAAVTWTLTPPLGTISALGLYTAPPTISTPQTVTATATVIAQLGNSNTRQITLTAGASGPSGPSGAALAKFSMPELFGVSWPDQPIEFRYDGGLPPVATTRMIGPNGTEVAYQGVSSCSDTTAVKGCIVVRSSLPANSNYTWTLQSGVAPSVSAVNPVQITQAGTNWEIKTA